MHVTPDPLKPAAPEINVGALRTSDIRPGTVVRAQTIELARGPACKLAADYSETRT
ncbi:hypothetical protein [Aurantiacibacter spongiae]|uniref:hypothetical protein n=1 Tax=Aurantiacibacter spongiae TaxID=2488860 RepID=UPI0013152C8D|nr:hypothetical protein [Aurantiacibacter spongiae]